MSFTAAHHRFICGLWKSKTVPWHWTSLNYGHAQPNQYGKWTYASPRPLMRMWQLHCTPIHLSRDGDKLYYGLCLGRRTLYVLRHR